MAIAIDSPDIPYFDVGDPRFSVSSAEVREAREQHWCARVASRPRAGAAA